MAIVDICSLADGKIQTKIGEKLKSLRLRQNITQANLASDTHVSHSSVKKMEEGQIGLFGSLLNVLRLLGKLDALQQLVEEEEMSVNEYYEFVNSVKKKKRQRAASAKTKYQIRVGLNPVC